MDSLDRPGMGISSLKVPDCLTRGILKELEGMGHLGNHAPLMEGVVSEKGRQASTISVRGRERLKTDLLSAGRRTGR